MGMGNIQAWMVLCKFLLYNNRYKGNWYGDRQHGQGCEFWSDGSKYEGKYDTGKKTGYGQFHWGDGSKYHGTFVKNMLNGKGLSLLITFV